MYIPEIVVGFVMGFIVGVATLFVVATLFNKKGKQ